MIVVVWRRAEISLRGLLCLRFIQVFTAQTVAIGGQLLDTRLCVILRGAVCLKFSGNAINGQVLIHEEEEAGLDLFKHFFSQLADKSVVILTLDMDYKFFIPSFCALR